MAKTKKAAPKRGTKQSRKQAEQVLTDGPIRKARNAPLPGMEDARIEALDDVCSSIAENREEMNNAKKTDSELLSQALRLMREHKKTTWRSHGVELARVPGEEKIRCRTSKESASAETDEDEDDDDITAMDAGAGA